MRPDGKGRMKPFCVNENCVNFLPEDKRGYYKKKTAESGEGEPAEKEEKKASAKKETKKKTTSKKTSSAKKTTTRKTKKETGK